VATAWKRVAGSSAALAMGLALGGFPAGALAQAQPTPALRDSAAVVATDQVVEAAAAWCDRESPPEAARLRSAQAAWRERQGVAAVRDRLAALAPGQAAPSPEVARRIGERMAREGAPARTCEQMTASLATPAMDLRQRHPAAYEAGALAAARPGVATPAAAPNAPVAVVAPAGATVINPAQLSAMLERARKVKDVRDRLAAVGLAGTIYIKGRVVRRGESLFLDHVDGAFHSRMMVSPSVDLKGREGQEVVVSGRLEELPLSLAFLRSARLLTDTQGLVASNEPAEPGLVRMTVEADRIRAAPGKGVPLADIAGVLYHGRGAVGGDGNFTFKEDAIVLLRDGWAYDRLDVPPSDLDLKASRELEPQNWLRWRRAGSGFEVQAQDDHGKPKGEWRVAGGSLKAPWPAGAKLSGIYTTASFVGSAALGGTYFRNSHIFHDDGRYQDSNLTQSGSGSMAAQMNGFSAGGSSHSGASGTQSSAGGGNQSVAVATSSRRDDGAEHRGRYSVDGYTLEIRYDSGRVSRMLSFPGAVSDAIWIGSRSYTPQNK
jgi:hypothetical protein